MYCYACYRTCLDLFVGFVSVQFGICSFYSSIYPRNGSYKKSENTQVMMDESDEPRADPTIKKQ